MQITVRSQAEAERIVAHVWLVLERTNLPSPNVTCRLQALSLIVELQFEQQIHENLVREEFLSLKGDEHPSREPEPWASEGADDK